MITVERDGHRFHVARCEALPTFWYGMYSKGWERSTTDLVASLVRPGAVFVDVGAWIGPISLYAAAARARVIAVEPDPVAHDDLVRNVEANRASFEHPVSIWRGAVVAAEGEGASIAPAGGYGDSMTRLVSSGGMRVDAWTLPRILETEGLEPAEVALVKIDVEGYETTLMPILGPWLGEHGIPVLTSFHGRRLDPEWFSAHPVVEERVEWVSPGTGDVFGDVVALAGASA